MSQTYLLKLLIKRNDETIARAAGSSDNLQVILKVARAAIDTCEEPAAPVAAAELPRKDGRR